MTGIDDAQRARIEKGTGLPFSRIQAVLDPHLGDSHTEQARRAGALIRAEGSSSNPDWWAQMATVGWEQHVGIRSVGERCDGTFSASVSKTIPGDMDAVLARIVDKAAGREDFAGVPVEAEPTASATEKRRYWKVKLTDGSRVTLTIQTKPAGTSGGVRTGVGVNHDRIPEKADVEAAKAWWREFLSQI